MIEKTLAILKPDAVKKNVIGKIISRVEDEGFKITAMRLAKPRPLRPSISLSTGFH